MKKISLFFIQSLCVGLFGLLFNVAHAQPHIVLVQNSGWMEPFYTDPNSQFADLVNALIQTIGKTSGDITLATFSQATPEVVSPSPIKRGTAQELAGLAKNINIQTKGKNPNVWADTDFKQAISAAVNALPSANAQGKTDQKEGVIWLITNNKNSPSNDQNTVKRNKEYYEFLHHTDGFSRILAWPLKMPVKGKLYTASGVMIYALAYGPRSGEQLQSFANGEIKALLTEQPARLKPHNAEVVIFKPTGVENSKDVSASLGDDGKTIIINFDAGGYVQTAKLQGTFVNTFNVYDIEKASLSANYGGHPLNVIPDTLGRVGSGQQSPIHALALTIPPLKNMWSVDVLFNPGQSLFGTVEIKLDQQLSLSKTYEQKFKDIFPNDPLPELFKPSQTAAVSSTFLPLKININYPAWPLFLIVLLVLIVLLGALALLWLSKQEKRYTISVDGNSRSLLLPAFKAVAIKSEQGQTIAYIKRQFGRPQLSQVSPDHTVTIKN